MRLVLIWAGIGALFFACASPENRIVRYDTPESIVADYARATSVIASSAALNMHLIDYYTCKAF